MKKTLVAIAALAAVSAFAQSSVTLSGNYGVGFAKDPVAGAKAGLLTTDGQVTFNATEDLGGGTTAGANLGVKIRGRDAGGSTNGRDATLFVQGGFGRLTLGAVEAGNGIQGLGHAGAPVSLPNGYDGSVLKGGSNIDMLRYDIAFGAIGARLVRSDSVTAPGAGNGAIQANTIGASYANGPIAADIDFTSFSGASTNKRTRMSASYDLSVAKLGFGFEKNKDEKGQFALGVSAPVGAHSVGFIYDKNQETKASGWGLGFGYNMSKRTGVNFSAGSLKTGGTSEGQYRIKMVHSF